jgi:hypothetical protein
LGRAAHLIFSSIRLLAVTRDQEKDEADVLSEGERREDGKRNARATNRSGYFLLHSSSRPFLRVVDTPPIGGPIGTIGGGMAVQHERQRVDQELAVKRRATARRRVEDILFLKERQNDG